MSEHFIELSKAVAEFVEARRRGEVSAVPVLKINGHGSLCIVEVIDDKASPHPFGDHPAVIEAGESMRKSYEELTGKKLLIPAGSARWRNGEILKKLIPVLVKYILPILIAEGVPSMMSTFVEQMIDN